MDEDIGSREVVLAVIGVLLMVAVAIAFAIFA